MLSFLWIGVTFAIFIRVGNSPVSKQRFISSESQIEKNSLKAFNRNIGIPNGPVDLDESRRPIIFSISSGPVTVRKKEQPFGLVRRGPLHRSPLVFLPRFAR